ncbi:D-alanyl-D-alanine dipeptidase [candidate division WOR-3 bacterium]|uniref:D-alanyl-D-alanine dipeptidase n=1 Tax=candidate division WOR-3 bacterium TaxID=2052148 RepID=A0A9D5QDR3_UNCW3|nr:D-alanyl-D-alanine dipeptidase [candidate division WOR-3 bacterium]MBD3364320.1 D-alanyl-D-alanine dipeptidase [candidate division WOR-3 bacterium]
MKTILPNYKEELIMKRINILLMVLFVFTSFQGCGKKEVVVEEEVPVDTLPSLPENPAAFVELIRLDSTIVLDIKYATTDNFTGEILYPEACCFARTCMAESLVRVSKKARILGYRLKVFDCYRPQRVQFRMWELVPDSRYVANPKRGSRHNRGTAVDLTLLDSTGSELDMGSGFDEFTERSHRNYQGLTEEQRENRELLTHLMTSTGFTIVNSEWWHYDYFDWKEFPLIDVSFDSLEYIGLSTADSIH